MITTELLQKIQKKGTVLAVAQFPHTSDNFLFLVLIYTSTQFVVWMYNSQVNGFSDGNYCEGENARARAYAVFMARLNSKTIIAGIQ